MYVRGIDIQDRKFYIYQEEDQGTAYHCLLLFLCQLPAIEIQGVRKSQALYIVHFKQITA